VYEGPIKQNDTLINRVKLKCYCGEQFKDDETSGTSRTYGRCEKLILFGTPLFGPKLEDIINMNVKEINCEAMYRIQLARDSIRWRSPVKMAMKIWSHKRRQNSSAIERLSSSQEGFCSMELVQWKHI
jgi:hypothetical protein